MTTTRWKGVEDIDDPSLIYFRFKWVKIEEKVSRKKKRGKEETLQRLSPT